MKVRLLVFAAVVAASLTGFCAAAKGSCISKAKSLSSTQAVTLVNEYEPDEKEYYDSGVCYYSVTLSRGQAYTIWITGGDATGMSLDVGTNDEYYDDREDEPSAGFDIQSLDDGDGTQVAYLYADDWDLDEDGDPKSGKYIVSISGEIGARTTLGFFKGIKTFAKTGTEGSPKVISMGTGWKSFSSRLMEGAYYFRASLKADRKYRVYLTGGKKDLALGCDVDGVSDTAVPNDVTDTQYANAYNDALILVPNETGKYTFLVEGDTAQAFALHYKMVPTRAISAHVAFPLLPENGYESKFVPGRMANTQSYYDGIIDEHLCRIYLNKGERWVFETEGATKAQKMIAYNSAGTVIATNESLDNDSFDSRVVISASAAGIYYVGVYDPSLEIADMPNAGQIRLTARNTADFAFPDDFDPADNVYTAANKLTAVPEGSSNQVVDATAFVHGPHRLGMNDLYDCFAIPCRKGFTYTLTGAFADANEISFLQLATKVFYISGGAEKTVTTTGTLTPVEARDASVDSDLTFTAPISGMYYVRVWVAEGKGLDYPGYTVCAKVDNSTRDLGLIRLEATGVGGSFSVGTESVRYPSGSVLTMATNASLKVTFNAATGFTPKPAATNVVVPAFTDGASPVMVTSRYYDNYDAKYAMGTKTVKNAKTGKVTTTTVYSPATGDATASGAFAITPTYAAATVKRTFWADDPADCFSFTAGTNVYYNFKLTDTTVGGVGDATLVISNALQGVVMTADEITKALLPTGRTYVVVSHTNAVPADSSYSLTYSRAAGGVVKFTASSFSTKEGSEYALLTVARTGKEGVTRIRYATQAGTALPGTNYYPVTDGVLSWANGDNANKTIKIRLVPDMVAHWAASNLTFKVRLYPVDEYDVAAAEYLARPGLAEAKVTIVETTAKKPGTISLASYGPTNAAVTNVKAPAVRGVVTDVKEDGGTPLVLTFTRTGGSDGKVSVRVVPTAPKTDTALAATDYLKRSTVLTWEDGDAEPKQMALTLYKRSSGDLSASRKFTLGMSVVATGFVPTLSAKTATVTILNDLVTQTSAAYVKTIAAATGVKLATSGTWFKDPDGTFRSAPANGSVTFTLTGPGLFVCEPELVLPVGFEGPNTTSLTWRFNAEPAVNSTNAPARVVRLVPAGVTTVKFSLTGVTGGSYMRFRPQPSGEPYAFTLCKGTAPAAPLNKAVVQTSLATLGWKVPAALAVEEGVYTRVRFGTTASPTTVLGYGPATQTSLAVTNALTAGKTYYWAVDYTYTNATGLAREDLKTLKWRNGPSTWSFTTIKAGAPITAVGGGTDAAGDDISALVAAGEPVELIQCVKLDLALDGDGEGEKAVSANQFRLLAGSLPKGVTINAATGRLAGCPTTVGTYTALLQSFNKTGKTVTKTVNGVKKKVTTYTYVYGTTLPVTFKVVPAGTALGTWYGNFEEDGATFPEDSRRVGLITLSASSAGKLTAKATIAGVAYTFSGTTGYDELLSRDETLPGVTRRFKVELKNTTTIAKKAYANYLTLEIDDGATTNAAALAEATASVELRMQVANAARTSVTRDITYRGTLARNNAGTAVGKAAIADYGGYYTLALVPEGVAAVDGVPVGSGYLTLTVLSTGAVKVSGVLADGYAVSFSTIAQLVGADPENPRACALIVPVCVSKSNYALAGALKIVFEGVDAEMPVVQPSSKLLWVRNASSATSRDASGFAIELAPTGGWYNKTVNLQAYYLGRDFAVQGAAAEELPAEALASSAYAFSTDSSPQHFWATPEEQALKITGNTMSVAARKLVKNKTTALYDFDQSVNPWNVTVKYVRATGLVSGTFSVWEWAFKHDDVNTFATAQKEIAKLSHKGVLLFSRDASGESPLREDAVSAGFFLMPATKTWKASLPFNIIDTTEDAEPVWDEKDFDD